MTKKLFASLCAVLVFVVAGSVSAQDDPLGKIDTVTLVINTLEEGKWMVSAHVWNDEELAAIDVPISYTAGMARLKIDSVSFADTRIDYFAQKYAPVDAETQTMHFGGLAYMGPDKPPLAPGSGEVARVYISVTGDKKAKTIAIDTTTVKPNNTLMLVDKNAKIIVPALKIVDAADFEKEKKEKKAKKEE
jgi:hypothetical protein